MILVVCGSSRPTHTGAASPQNRTRAIAVRKLWCSMQVFRIVEAASNSSVGGITLQQSEGEEKKRTRTRTSTITGKRRRKGKRTRTRTRKKKMKSRRWRGRTRNRKIKIEEE